MKSRGRNGLSLVGVEFYLVLVAPFAGVFADGWNPKALILVADLMQALAVRAHQNPCEQVHLKRGF